MEIVGYEVVEARIPESLDLGSVKEERDVSEEIKKYTMFLIDERACEEVQRITV